MNHETDPGGDQPIDLAKRQFSLVDAAFLARVPRHSVRNWQARNALDIGAKNPITGRWEFSIAEIAKLAVMFDLCSTAMTFNPQDAATIADEAVRAGIESTGPGRSSDRPNVNLLIGWTEAGEIAWCFHDIDQPGHYRPPVRSDNPADFVPLRRAHACIPCTALVIDIILRTQALAERNAKQERPIHV